MKNNSLSEEVEEWLIERRLYSIAFGFVESVVGLVSIASLYGIPVGFYLLTDGVSSVATGQRTMHLTRSILERMDYDAGQLKTSDIRQVLKGDWNAVRNYNKRKLNPEVVEVGSSFFIDGEVPYVTVQTRVSRVDDNGFDYIGKNLIGRHTFGLDDGGILIRKEENGRLMFYREPNTREVWGCDDGK